MIRRCTPAIDPQILPTRHLKNPPINLTQRIGELVMVDGINVRSAQVPPGTHYLRVEVKDTAGRVGSTTFALLVLN